MLTFLDAKLINNFSIVECYVLVNNNEMTGRSEEKGSKQGSKCKNDGILPEIALDCSVKGPTLYFFPDFVVRPFGKIDSLPL